MLQTLDILFGSFSFSFFRFFPSKFFFSLSFYSFVLYLSLLESFFFLFTSNLLHYVSVLENQNVLGFGFDLSLGYSKPSFVLSISFFEI